MKYIGIDYGTKKTGIAVSDALGSIAFPRKVLVTDKSLSNVIADLIESEGIGAIVVGESKDRFGGLNKVDIDIKKFVETLKSLMSGDIVIHHEDERYTTKQARSLPNEQVARGVLSNRRKGVNKVNSLADAQAAAIILQTFLDKRENLS